MSNHNDALTPPPPSAVFNELTALFELPRLLLQAPMLASKRAVDRAPVMVLPGFGSTDLSTVPLRACLNAAGFDALGWGLGRNGGDVEALLPKVSAAVILWTADSRRCSWSAEPGRCARAVARDLPDHVQRGTCWARRSSAAEVHAGRRPLRRARFDLDEPEHNVAVRHRIYQGTDYRDLRRLDGIVAWRRVSIHGRRISSMSVRSSHSIRNRSGCLPYRVRSTRLEWRGRAGRELSTAS
jgi:hypothetical protein